MQAHRGVRGTSLLGGPPRQLSDETRPGGLARAPRDSVDFYKLPVIALKRYCNHFKLADGGGTSTKDELVPRVEQHFHQSLGAFDEEDMILLIANTLKKKRAGDQYRYGKGKNGAKLGVGRGGH